MDHLLSVNNAYNLRVLELMQRNPIEKNVLDQTHHIIPYSAGGLRRKLNEIRVTEYEHLELHLLRLEVYNESADAYVFNFCWAQLPNNFKYRLRINTTAQKVLKKWVEIEANE